MADNKKINDFLDFLEQESNQQEIKVGSLEKLLKQRGKQVKTNENKDDEDK